MTLRTAGLSVLLGVSACAGLAPQTTTVPVTDKEAVVIEVENHRLADLNVFLVRNQTWTRLGAVGVEARNRFVVPGWLFLAAPDLRLGLAEMADRSVKETTEPFFAAPGQRMAFAVQPNLFLRIR